MPHILQDGLGMTVLGLSLRFISSKLTGLLFVTVQLYELAENSIDNFVKRILFVAGRINMISEIFQKVRHIHSLVRAVQIYSWFPF